MKAMKMAKYILHGGRTSIPSEDNKQFFNEMITGLEEPITVLCVYFARNRDEWLKLFEQDKIVFSKASPHKKYRFSLAEDNKEKFIQQIKITDIVYIRGGRTALLAEALRNVKDLKDLFKDKIIGGSSAGANILSKYYYSISEDCIREGLGILPIKVFCHYSKDKVEKLNKLKNYNEDLKVYTIPEQKSIVIEE